VSDALEQQVVAIVAKKKKLDQSRVTMASTFEELGIDSLDAADLLFAFEDEFKIVVPDDAAHSMKTVGQVVDGLRTLVAARPGEAAGAAGSAGSAIRGGGTTPGAEKGH
jgi:acyl carrier protein